MDRDISGQKRISKTAMMAAVYRHLSLTESNPAFSTQDTLAKLFIPAALRFLLEFAWFRRYLRNKLQATVPGTYPYVIARAKFFDEQFLNALRVQVPQIVLLGAGYDTRAIRYQSRNQGCNIFELDTPALLARKAARLARGGVALPASLTLCPTTFGHDDLANMLEKSGYVRSVQTLFMWEGVTYYLPSSAVFETLSFINEHAAEGSAVVFDYFYRDFIEGDQHAYGARELAASIEEVGEPFMFGIDPGELEALLDRFGFSVLRRYNPEALERRYLVRQGKSLGRVYGFAECVCATLSPRKAG
jgi:methyltransferase (TIGR00027 family)